MGSNWHARGQSWAALPVTTTVAIAQPLTISAPTLAPTGLEYAPVPLAAILVVCGAVLTLVRRKAIA